MSAQFTSLEGTIAEHKSLVTQLRAELSALQNQENNIPKAVAVRPGAGASAVGRVQRIGEEPSVRKNDLHALQAEWRTLRDKESPLLDIWKSLEGQVVVLDGEQRAAQVELADYLLRAMARVSLRILLPV